MFKFVSNNEKETKDIGFNLASKLREKTVVILTGDLGSGKTLFTKGFAQAMAVTEPVTSPTFNIIKEYNSFYNYLRQFIPDKTIYEIDKTTSELSDKISKDLTSRGMKYVGSTIIYSYLQAIGVIYSHEKDCFLYKNDN